VKEECPVNISAKLAAFENLDFNGDINRIWENIKEYIKISKKKESKLLRQCLSAFVCYCITITYKLMYTLKAAFCNVLHMNVSDQMWLNGDSLCVHNIFRLYCHGTKMTTILRLINTSICKKLAKPQKSVVIYTFPDYIVTYFSKEHRTT
jgi:hypothetical protein